MIKFYSNIDNSLLFILTNLTSNIKDRVDLTPSEYPVQMSICNMFEGNEIPPHKHKSKPNDGLSFHPHQECWIIANGHAEVTLFDIDNTQINQTFHVCGGDILITFGGGHSFKSLSDRTQIIEIKNGPYEGKDTIKI